LRGGHGPHRPPPLSVIDCDLVNLEAIQSNEGMEIKADFEQDGTSS